jgi:hypothetical protein
VFARVVVVAPVLPTLVVLLLALHPGAASSAW